MNEDTGARGGFCQCIPGQHTCKWCLARRHKGDMANARATLQAIIEQLEREGTVGEAVINHYNRRYAETEGRVYEVTWGIKLKAASPHEAALEAFDAMITGEYTKMHVETPGGLECWEGDITECKVQHRRATIEIQLGYSYVDDTVENDEMFVEQLANAMVHCAKDTLDSKQVTPAWHAIKLGVEDTSE